ILYDHGDGIPAYAEGAQPRRRTRRGEEVGADEDESARRQRTAAAAEVLEGRLQAARVRVERRRVRARVDLGEPRSRSRGEPAVALSGVEVAGEAELLRRGGGHRLPDGAERIGLG